MIPTRDEERTIQTAQAVLGVTRHDPDSYWDRVQHRLLERDYLGWSGVGLAVDTARKRGYTMRIEALPASELFDHGTGTMYIGKVWRDGDVHHPVSYQATEVAHAAWSALNEIMRRDLP